MANRLKETVRNIEGTPVEMERGEAVPVTKEEGLSTLRNIAEMLPGSGFVTGVQKGGTEGGIDFLAELMGLAGGALGTVAGPAGTVGGYALGKGGVKGLRSLLKSEKAISPLRRLFEDLPEEIKQALPKQPNKTGLYGYHGSSKGRLEEKGKDYFDIKFGNPNDQFMGEGFYFTINPKVAEEYANLRATKDFQPVRGGKGDTLFINPETKEKATTTSLMKGVDIEGKPLLGGQNISRFNLENIEKPYIITNNKQRLYAKENIDKLKEEGYDSILFKDFNDRSQQILVFPEHIGKVASKTTKETVAAENIPTRWYRGTDNPKELKNPAQWTFGKEGSLGGGGVYITPNPEAASKYASKGWEGTRTEGGFVTPLDVIFEKPLVVELNKNNGYYLEARTLEALGVPVKKAESMAEKALENKGGFTTELKKRALDQGYDGIIVKKDGEITEAISYKPEKSIISSITKKSKGGSVIERNPYNYQAKAI